MAFLTTRKANIYFSIICLFGVIAPFIHIVYGINDKEGLFGYKYMSSFLYAIGNRVSMLCFGLLLLFASSQIYNEYKRVIKNTGMMFLFISSFFIIQIMVPKKLLFGTNDLPSSYYYIAMIILSISSGFTISLFHKALISIELTLKNKIKHLISFILKNKEVLNEEELITTLEKTAE